MMTFIPFHDFNSINNNTSLQPQFKTDNHKYI